MIPNLAALASAAAGLDPHDWREFAKRCAKLSGPLGVVVAMHAQCADGNSPDVQDWVESTLREWLAVADMTDDQARDWWLDQYEDPVARRDRLADERAWRQRCDAEGGVGPR